MSSIQNPRSRTSHRWKAILPGLSFAVTLGCVAEPALGQLAAQDQTARGVTVLTRPRPDYDPPGMRLGAFTLRSLLGVGGGFDDNPIPDGIRSGSASFLDQDALVALSSDWTRHAISIEGTQASRRYFNRKELDWDDYTVTASGRYDIGRASALRIGYSRLRGHIEPGSLDAEANGLDVPSPFTSDRVVLGGLIGFNRISLDTSVTYQTIRYENVGSTGAASVADRNDYDSLAAQVEAAYLLQPGRSLTLLTRLTDIAYQQQDGLRSRDSKTIEVLAGARYDLSGLWAARVGIGYQIRDYEDPLLPNLTGPVFEGEIVFLPSQVLTVTFGAQRRIQESLREESVSATATTINLRLDYEARRNLLLSADLRGERREYERPDATANDAIGTLSARLLLNRNISISSSFRHVRRLDALPGQREYERNMVLVRLQFAL